MWGNFACPVGRERRPPPHGNMSVPEFSFIDAGRGGDGTRQTGRGRVMDKKNMPPAAITLYRGHRDNIKLILEVNITDRR